MMTNTDFALRLPIWGAFLLLSTLLPQGAAQQPRFGLVHETPIPNGAHPAFATAAGDVDGDGDIDLFVASFQSNQLLLNDGSGHFTDASAQLPTVAGFALDCEMGDVDGDGDLDIVLASLTLGGGITIFINGGGGTFTLASPAIILPAGSIPQSVELGDLDGDGDLDIVAAGGQVLVVRNTGGGTFAFAAAAVAAGVITGTKSVGLSDLDGDGDLDILASSAIGATAVLINSGFGTFAPGTGTFPPGAAPIEQIVLGDVDGDGDDDAFLILALSGAALYLNDGSGGFSVAPVQLPTLSGYARTISLVDVDADGDIDALAGTNDSSVLLVNSGAGLFTVATGQVPQDAELTGSTAFAVADLDQDGDPDVYNGSSAPTVWFNDGMGSFQILPGLTPVIGRTTNAVALGDLDADGDLDAVVGNDGLDHLLINDGSGAFDFVGGATSAFPSPGGSGANDVRLSDVDGDGDLDALLMTPGAPIALLLNNGAAVFTDASSQIVNGPSSEVSSFDVGDVDADGDIDLLVGTGAPFPNRLFLNDGSGNFMDASGLLPGLLAHTSGVHLVDVDTDGDLDAIIRRLQGTIGYEVWINNGTGAFTALPLASPPNGPGLSEVVALGDVDGDGDVDIATSAPRLYLNNGAGVFTLQPSSSAFVGAHPGLSAAGLFDIDGDGDLDLVTDDVKSGSPSGNRLYINDGTGVFTAAPSALPAIRGTTALAAADLDGDGDVDVFAGNSGQDRIFTGLTRQLAWRQTPRYSRPLTLDIWGPPNSGWALLASLGTGSQMVPPLGVFRLDLASTVVVAQGTLDAQGMASLSTVAAPNPGGPPLTFDLQAVVGASSLRFTNLEILRFLDL